MKDNDSTANFFLFVLFAVFVASLSAIIFFCSDKFNTEPIVTPLSSQSSSLTSKVWGFLFIIVSLVI